MKKFGILCLVAIALNFVVCEYIIANKERLTNNCFLWQQPDLS